MATRQGPSSNLEHPLAKKVCAIYHDHYDRMSRDHIALQKACRIQLRALYIVQPTAKAPTHYNCIHCMDALAMDKISIILVLLASSYGAVLQGHARPVLSSDNALVRIVVASGSHV
jgi:hypothetical protein